MDFPRYAKVRLILVLLFALKAQAFPDLIRHGYTGCLNCHSSVVGGDLLSAYGRSVKNELVVSNFWTLEEKEQKEGRIRTPEWFQTGLNVRLLQYFKESSAKSQGRFLIMQVDFDAVATFLEKWKVYLSVGRYEPSDKDATWRDFLYTPREWIGYEDDFLGQERGFQVRLGRFNPAYGIYMAEHSFGPRKFLGFNPGQERLGVEASFSKDDHQLVLTGLAERANYNKYISENGYIFQYSKNFEKPWRVGVNVYRSQLGSELLNQKVKMDGIFAVISWNEQWSSLIQIDRTFNAANKEGRNFFFKLDKEVELGWHVFGVLEYFNSQIEKTDPHVDSLGIGTNFFWTPNVDFQAFYKKEKNTSDLNEYQDVLWFVLHGSL